jgi:hypothetical protein
MPSVAVHYMISTKTNSLVMATHGAVIILDDIGYVKYQDVLAKDVHFFDMKPAV